MKILITFILFTISYCHVNAQEVYPFINKALKHVDKYSYEKMTVPRELKNVSANGEIVKKELKLISDKLNTAEFKFDKLNDTLLIILSYEDNIVGGIPYRIFAQSSQSIKALDCDSYRNLNYVELSPVEQITESYYSLLYSGTAYELKELVSHKGRVLGVVTIVLRVIIQNGNVLFPSFLWYY